MILSSRPITPQIRDRQIDIVIEALAELQVALLDATSEELDAERQTMVIGLDAIIDIIDTFRS